MSYAINEQIKLQTIKQNEQYTLQKFCKVIITSFGIDNFLFTQTDFDLKSVVLCLYLKTFGLLLQNVALQWRTVLPVPVRTSVTHVETTWCSNLTALAVKVGCLCYVKFTLLQSATSNVITSAKEVMFSPGFVCGFVSLFVNKITQKLMD